MKSLKIAFVKIGSFSNTNKSVLSLLEKEFSSYSIDVIDVFEEIAQPKTLKNFLHAFKEHGFKMFSSKVILFKSLVQNKYFFELVKKRMALYLAEEEYKFTFQTQSLFDTSIKGIPNFMYTDNTTLATQLYPNFDFKSESISEAWFYCEKSIYNNATINFTMSENISKSIIEDYDTPRSKVSCVGIAPNATIPNNINIGKDKYASPHILFVGKDWAPKGGPELVEAFIALHKSYPEVKLTIVGCSPDIDVPNCNVVGRVPVSEVGDYFSNASIFCLPTLREAFGIVYLEAMAYSIPVIGSNIGAIPEFIIENKNGFLCEVGDITNLTKKLIELIESPEKCKLFGSYGRNLYLEKYTWDNVGMKIRNNINTCLEND